MHPFVKSKHKEYVHPPSSCHWSSWCYGRKLWRWAPWQPVRRRRTNTRFLYIKDDHYYFSTIFFNFQCSKDKITIYSEHHVLIQSFLYLSLYQQNISLQSVLNVEYLSMCISIYLFSIACPTAKPTFYLPIFLHSYLPIY